MNKSYSIISTDEKQSDEKYSENYLNEKIPENKWISQIREVNHDRSFKPAFVLDETYEKLDVDIPGLKTRLYLHQRTIIKAMIDLENNRRIVIHNKPYSIDTSAGVLSEPVGSGKTIDILTLILVQKRPKVFKDICEFGITHPYKDGKNLIYQQGILFKKFKTVLIPTIIFVGVSVLNQWILAIEQFTTLKYFAVGSLKELRDLCEMIRTKEVNKYDIILVKNGTVAHPIELPPDLVLEKRNQTTTPFIYNLISNFRNRCWSRVVIDDFDTINMPKNIGVVNGLFTWYISSTRKSFSFSNYTGALYTSDLFMYGNKCSNVINNNLLFTNINIRNSENFIKQSNQLVNPKFYAYIFKNKNNTLIHAIGGIDSEEAKELVEMLNSDSIETAAERAGIATTNVVDIFEKILGDKYQILSHAVAMIKFAKSQQQNEAQRRHINQCNDERKTYNRQDLSEYKEILFNYPGIKEWLIETIQHYEKVKAQMSKELERVYENLKAGECPICFDDLSSQDNIYIFKCCNLIICHICCFGSVFIGGRLGGNCSNCRAAASIKTLIHINTKNFDFNKLTNAMDVDNINDEQDESKIDIKEIPEYKKQEPRTKMLAILDIIKGITAPEQRHVNVAINNLMNAGGNEDFKFDGPPPVKKILIFANYDETLKNVCKMLDDNQIYYLTLGGTHTKINQTARMFCTTTVPTVLVVNSMKHCSGLNLQVATDLIFAHHIKDRNIESQVAGRGQRLGRQSQLNIHYMLYDNEYNELINTNVMRLI
jgi:hypothetical protein